MVVGRLTVCQRTIDPGTKLEPVTTRVRGPLPTTAELGMISEIVGGPPSGEGPPHADCTARTRKALASSISRECPTKSHDPPWLSRSGFPHKDLPPSRPKRHVHQFPLASLARSRAQRLPQNPDSRSYSGRLAKKERKVSSVRKRGRRWYLKWTGEDGRPVERASCTQPRERRFRLRKQGARCAAPCPCRVRRKNRGPRKDGPTAARTSLLVKPFFKATVEVRCRYERTRRQRARQIPAVGR